MVIFQILFYSNCQHVHLFLFVKWEVGMDLNWFEIQIKLM